MKVVTHKIQFRHIPVEYQQAIITVQLGKPSANITDPWGAQFEFVFISTFGFSSECWSKQAALDDWPYVRILVA